MNVLIFDNLNDIVFMKCNHDFCLHIQSLAKFNGLISDEQDFDEDESWLTTDVIMQLFSPLVTSHRIMSSHFSNGYSNIQCIDGTNVSFEEYMGHLLVHISFRDKNWVKKVSKIGVAVVRNVCGPNVSLLKSCQRRRKLVNLILDAWFAMYKSEQCMLVEAVEQLRVNSQIAVVTLKTLSEAVNKIKSATEYGQIHALITVNRRFLSLYSSRNAIELKPEDILFLSLVGEISEDPGYAGNDAFLSLQGEGEDSDDDTYRTANQELNSSHSSTRSSIDKTGNNAGIPDHFVMLLGNHKPYGIHVSRIAANIYLFFLHEIGNEGLNVLLIECIRALCLLQESQMHGTTDKESLRPIAEACDLYVKKLTDLFGKKKHLPGNVWKMYQPVAKNVSKKWDAIKKKYHEYFKTVSVDTLQTLDSPTNNLLETLKSLYSCCMLDDSLIDADAALFSTVSSGVAEGMKDYAEFLKVKSQRNFTISSKSSLSINKYLEEFPGLVHFLYIDRVTHRLVAPSFDFSSEETAALTKRKIWSMVDFSRDHLESGYTSLMWKDTTFNYSYFLWFEDQSGTPLKPKISPRQAAKNLPMPGILCGDFYRQLMEKCFPKCHNKVRCFELYCIHLGLVTSSCVLEHSRRLTATIWEITGVLTNPMDLL